MHLFIGAHSDDIPLCCGGTIHHLTTTKGESVKYLTVMSGDPLWMVPDTPIIRDLHQRWGIGDDAAAGRRVEDIEAGKVLGAQVQHTPIPDCVYRVFKGEALYPTEESIFADVHTDDDARDILLAMALPEAESVTHLYIPLAVGHHVDHQIVRDTGLALMKQFPQVRVQFYEDYPYVAEEGTLEKTLAELPFPMKPSVQRLDETNVRAKIDAVLCYKSQISTFWQDTDALETSIRAYMNKVGEGQPAERFWTL